MEIWKQIPGYEIKYEVSNYGNVRNIISNKILKSSVSKRGYYVVTLWEKGNGRTLTIHRLVMLAFMGKSDLVVDHIDRNKLNNELSNLRYCTQRENLSFNTKTLGVRPVRTKRLGTRYRSYIWVDGKQVYCGTYQNHDLARMAYNKKLEEIK